MARALMVNVVQGFPARLPRRHVVRDVGLVLAILAAVAAFVQTIR
jgi:hypothetical protein